MKTYSVAETKKVGMLLARKHSKSPLLKGALVIGLYGELGSGKTTFVQGVAKGFGVKGKVQSPTFVLIRRHVARQGRTVVHIDCWRLKKGQELVRLGWREIIKNPLNVVLVEWAERVESILPKGALRMRFRVVSPDVRTIESRH